MTDIEILTWAIGAGFVGTWVVMGVGFSMAFCRIDKLDEKLTDVDRRLCRIEGAMMSKECCMLSSSNKEKAQ